jgi:hypothetical protein
LSKTDISRQSNDAENVAAAVPPAWDGIELFEVLPRHQQKTPANGPGFG